VARELLFVTRPPKPWSMMSDEEKRAWARSIVQETRRRMRPEQRRV
jgi:hypothetical protein